MNYTITCRFCEQCGASYKVLNVEKNRFCSLYCRRTYFETHTDEVDGFRYLQPRIAPYRKPGRKKKSEQQVSLEETVGKEEEPYAMPFEKDIDELDLEKLAIEAAEAKYLH